MQVVHPTINSDMKLLNCLIVLFFISVSNIAAQKYYSKTGNIHFLSEAPLEKIEATNNNAYAVFDAASGQMEWSVLIKGFKFEKSLMQQHFNENYMESSKFPKAIFKGQLVKPSATDLSKNGDYPVEVKGNMTMHGVTKPLSVPARIIVKDGKITAKGNFSIAIADYGIEVPKIVRDNIAKTVHVTVDAELLPMNK